MRKVDADKLIEKLKQIVESGYVVATVEGVIKMIEAEAAKEDQTTTE